MEMGERLATEVKQYIISFCPASCLSKISFIGHSLGGLIIRAALPHLSEYSQKFFTYMSLSSPQLGQMYNKSSMIDAGLWVLKKWKKSKCLMQMSMTDESKMENTCLYRLSEMPGFCWFKNIVLLGST
jgi:alpha-beta hydrolase superfamily lysophospholipase